MKILTEQYGLTAEQQKWARDQLELGCVGITIANLGWNRTNYKYNSLDSRFPDLESCYSLKAQALKKMAEAQTNNDCKCKKHGGTLRMFSIHFWYKDKLEEEGDGHLNIDKWAILSKNDKIRPGTNVNFDFAWLDDKGTMFHGDHSGPGANIVPISPENWQAQLDPGGTFDRKQNGREVFCFACQVKGKEYSKMQIDNSLNQIDTSNK